MIDPTPPAFYRLSEELLTAIVDQVIDGSYSKQAPRLKTLRSVHPNFASLARLNQALFHNATLIATPEHPELVERTELKRLAPYVKRVLFKPSMYSWALSENDFQSIAKKCQPGSADDDRSSIAAGFEEYREEADSAHRSMVTGRTRAIWTAALRDLPNATAFTIGRWRHQDVDLESFANEEVRFVLRATLGNNEWSAKKGRGLASAPLGDELFNLVVGCIVGAAVKPTELDLHYDTLGDVRWLEPSIMARECANGKEQILEGLSSTAPAWTKSDLSCITRLTFRTWSPTQSVGETGPDGLWAREGVITCTASARLHALLTKCAPSIQFLEVDNDPSITFPYEDDLSLPDLRHLSLANTHLSAGDFASLLLMSPKLEVPRMRTTWVDGLYVLWKRIFTAIRDHPSRMQIHL